MKIEAGKRYIRRDGELSGTVRYHGGLIIDDMTGISYSENGYEWGV